MGFKYLKSFLLPSFTSRLRILGPKYGWFGDYKSWQEAQNDSTGYDADEIFEKVSKAALKVKDGEAVYERDAVIFDKIQYSWQLLASLMYVSTRNKGKLDVLDFGGALGTTYFQNRLFLENLSELNWSIVEQERFVEFGKRKIQNENLKFFLSIKECLKMESPSVLLLSSVLQYLENPYSFIEDLLEKYSFESIIIDRTGFTKGKKDRLTVQKVHPEIYDASYPCWFFSKGKFMEQFSDLYELLVEFPALDKCNVKAEYEGVFFRKYK